MAENLDVQLKSFQNLDQLSSFTDGANLKPQIGCLGGRSFVAVNKDKGEGNVTLASIVKIYKEIIQNAQKDGKKLEEATIAASKRITTNIRALESDGEKALKNSSFLKRFLAAIHQFFENLVYDYKAALAKIEADYVTLESKIKQKV